MFRFRAAGAAEAVMAGTRRRLANERMDESKIWFLDLSAGKAAAAIKAEAKGLSCSFAIIHPHLKDAPIVRSGQRRWARRAAGARRARHVQRAPWSALVVAFMLKG